MEIKPWTEEELAIMDIQNQVIDVHTMLENLENKIIALRIKMLKD